MRESLVMFDYDSHTYTCGGRNLISVTQLIKKYILPDQYNGADPVLLKEKAEYGRLVHSQTENFLLGLPNAEQMPETEAYIAYHNENKIDALCAEYLVSDEELVAGTIDQVTRAEKNNEVDIADYKTTSILNIEYLRWQLSIYAYLLEKQNTGLVVRNLYAYHLHHGECKRVQIERIPLHAIEALLEAERTGAAFFSNPLKASCDDVAKLMEQYKALSKDMLDIEAVYKQINGQLSDIKDKLYAIARDKGQDCFEDESYKVSIGKDSCRSTLDQKLLQEHSKAFLEAYMPKDAEEAESFLVAFDRMVSDSTKATQVKGRITIKLK